MGSRQATRAVTRCGCFLPDLTELREAPVHRRPPGACISCIRGCWGKVGQSQSIIMRPDQVVAIPGRAFWPARRPQHTFGVQPGQHCVRNQHGRAAYPATNWLKIRPSMAAAAASPRRRRGRGRSTARSIVTRPASNTRIRSANATGLGHVVGYHDRGKSLVLPDALDQHLHLHPGQRVERTKRLIERQGCGDG